MKNFKTLLYALLMPLLAYSQGVVPTGGSVREPYTFTLDLTVLGGLAASGPVTGSNLSGTNTGNVTLAAVGAVPNANGASLSGQVLTLQPANASFSGLMSAADYIKLAAISGTNTGDQTTISGNAGTATALQNARNINGVSFNGTANVTNTTADIADSSNKRYVTDANLTTIGNQSGTNTGDAALTGKDEGSTVTSNTTNINFVGSSVTATNVGGTLTVGIGNPADAAGVQKSNGLQGVMWRTALGAGSAAFSEYGTPTITTSGGTGIALSTAAGQRGYMRRAVYLTAGSANASIGWRFSALTHSIGSSSPSIGGFKAVCRFGFSNVTSPTLRWFVGMANQTAAIGTTADPSSILNMVGVGMDSGDSSIYIMHNDGTGTATKFSLGMTPSTTSYYEVEIEAIAGTVNVNLREFTGSGVVGNGQGGSTDLPLYTDFLGWHFHANSGASGAGGQVLSMDFSTLYIEDSLPR